MITTSNLTVKFGNFTAVNDINLSVTPGSIYGFLGPNGAGKTTTIKSLLGLLNPSKGSISVAGFSIPDKKLNAFKNIGAIVETPSLYEHLTGYENIEITRRLLKLKKERSAQILNLVDLNDQRDKKVAKYSLGMKQRLAIGLALLGDPALLILDEPVNGLDPQGIREIRELLIKINKEEGKTIFISSHILSEIDKVATHLGVLNKGRMIYQGTLEDFKKIHTSEYIIVTDNCANTISTLKEMNIYPNNSTGDSVSITIEDKTKINFVISGLITNKINLFEFYKKNHDLESLFLQLTNGDHDYE